jgi:hypothetical protein
MDNQDLISKLNNLKNTTPEAAWLASNRNLLLSQISNTGADNISAWQSFVISLSSLAKTASQPAFALGTFIILLLSGSFFSRNLFLNTKPNDSLYIARIISEKVRVNTTMDSDARNKLAMQYATEHAQDITKVLADPTFNNEANKVQVAKLNDSFKAEVATMQTKINNIDAQEVVSNKVVAVVPQVPAKINAATKNDNDNVVIADNARDKTGIQLDSSSKAGKEVVVEPAKATGIVPTKAATTTDTTSSTSQTVVKPNSANKILDEAQKLFDNKDYSEASKKLQEVEAIIK